MRVGRTATSAELLAGMPSTARFVAIRVVVAHDDGQPPHERQQEWLLIEWRDDEEEPANYSLSSLPARMTKKQLVRIVMQRWRAERAYEDRVLAAALPALSSPAKASALRELDALGAVTQ